MVTYEFDTPLSFAALLPLAVAAVLLSAFIIWRERRRGLTSAFRRLFPTLVPAALLVVAAGTPVQVVTRPVGKLLVLLDLSESNDEAIQQTLLKEAEKFATDEVALEYLPFAGLSTSSPLPLERGQSYAALQQLHRDLNLGETNIEQALRGASAAGAKGVLLLSDGFETEGRAHSALVNIASTGTSVFPLLTSAKSGGAQGVRIVNFSAPLTANPQEAVTIRTAVRNSSEERRDFVLEVLQGDKVREQKTLSLAANQEVVVETASDPAVDGLQPLVAVIKDRDGTVLSRERRFLSTAERERVILLSGSQQDERHLSQALKGKGYKLDTQLASRGDPARIPDFKGVSAVVLNNAEYGSLSPGLAQRLVEYVRGGGGLLMSGGDRSFGLGGYLNTQIADILPVEVVPPQTEKKRLNIAVQLVLDKSKSMDTGGKIEFAREAARETIKNLKPDDFVGVIGFDSTPFVVVRLEPVATNREMALSRVERLIASGRTNLLPAVDEARRSLAQVKAGRKHLIILTDGKLPGVGSYYLDAVRDLRTYGITVSTVMLGGEAPDDLLRALADEGGGSFYQTADPSSLPRIFLQDVKVASGERTMKESNEFQVRRGTGSLESTAVHAFPPLLGYVQTKPRGAANLELVAMAGGKAEPLLASWKVGKGRVVAFTSDANGRWSRDWIGWDRYYTFWSDLVSSLRHDKGDSATPLEFELRHHLRGDTLVLDLVVFNGTPGQTVHGTVDLPNKHSSEITFESAAPGRFRAELPRVSAGDFVFKLTQGDRTFPPIGISLSGDLFGERKGEGINTALLLQIAQQTGGKLNPVPTDLSQFATVEKEKKDLNHWLFALALLLFLVGVWWREKRGFRMGRKRKAIG